MTFKVPFNQTILWFHDSSDAVSAFPPLGIFFRDVALSKLRQSHLDSIDQKAPALQPSSSWKPASTQDLNATTSTSAPLASGLLFSF